MDALTQELEDLNEELNQGNISMKEYNKGVQELERSYRAEAEESAQDAYDEEMENW